MHGSTGKGASRMIAHSYVPGAAFTWCTCTTGYICKQFKPHKNGTVFVLSVKQHCGLTMKIKPRPAIGSWATRFLPCECPPQCIRQACGSTARALLHVASPVQHLQSTGPMACWTGTLPQTMALSVGTGCIAPAPSSDGTASATTLTGLQLTNTLSNGIHPQLCCVHLLCT